MQMKTRSAAHGMFPPAWTVGVGRDAPPAWTVGVGRDARTRVDRGCRERHSRPSGPWVSGERPELRRESSAGRWSRGGNGQPGSQLRCSPATAPSASLQGEGGRCWAQSGKLCQASHSLWGRRGCAVPTVPL